MRGDVVARAMRLIADGTVDRDGVTGLAGRLGYSTRQLERLLLAEVGAGPLALARAQRAQTARVLIETTDAAVHRCGLRLRLLEHPPVQRHGASGVRRDSDELAPGAAADRGRARPMAGRCWLPFRPPFAPRQPVRSSGRHRGAGRRGGARRCLPPDAAAPPRSGDRRADAAARPRAAAGSRSDDLRDLALAIARCRRLLDLDADPEAVVDALGADPALSALVAKAPGRRIPGPSTSRSWPCGSCSASRCRLKAARTHAGRLVAAYGTPSTDPDGGLTHLFPSVEELAEIDPAHLALPKSRQRSLSRSTAPWRRRGRARRRMRLGPCA